MELGVEGGQEHRVVGGGLAGEDLVEGGQLLGGAAFGGHGGRAALDLHAGLEEVGQLLLGALADVRPQVRAVVDPAVRAQRPQRLADRDVADAQPLGQAVGVEVGAGREGAGQDGLDQRVADAVAGVARAGAGVARERGRLVSVTPAIL
ncbi:hypothetical protein Psuf_074910 [Phytohabitans suffuscus]|uniref:Uncharacterized protein n=1 Tax=Phytohabitans suffuscus TaxID=624315 RepID=A0A6F8YW68_9ACTN|nr:hypothetical protein Psuf_074910 [Phytohabitans suffuscus]